MLNIFHCQASNFEFNTVTINFLCLICDLDDIALLNIIITTSKIREVSREKGFSETSEI